MTATRTVLGSLRGLLADAVHLDRGQSDPVVATRNAIGLLVPLVVAAALGNPAAGVLAAIGGLQTAFADRPGPYRLRVVRMVGTALAASVTAGLAAGLGANVIASAVLLAVLAFGAGQLLSISPSAAQVGIAATAAALILGHIPQPPLQAVLTGVLVFGGGLVQTLLAVAAWPVGRHRPERFALAKLYRQLAALAAHPIDLSTGPPLGPVIIETTAVLRGTGHDHGPSVESYRVLLDEAKRARRDILVLSDYAHRLHADHVTDAEALVRAELSAASAVIAAIAGSLQSGRPLEPATVARLLAPVGESTARLGSSPTAQAALNVVHSLAGQLRAMTRTARTGAGEVQWDDEVQGDPAGGPGRLRTRLREPVAVLRANFNLRSPALRHSSRLAVLVPLTDVVTRYAGLPRGYWVSLTVLVVLRPDFGATFQRSLMRVLGTLVGLLLASVVVHYLIGGSTAGLIVLLGLFFFGMRLSGPTNVGPASVCLAGVVVVLLSLAGYPAHATVVDRSIDTVVGGAIALVAALLWPSWERRRIPERLASLLAAYREYLQALVDPDSTEVQHERTRSAARLARSAAEASVDRARAEPVDSQGNVELGSAVLAHSNRLVHALTAMDATTDTRAVYRDVPQFRALIDAVLHGLRLAQRATGAVEDQPSELGLRPLQIELVGSLEATALTSEVRAALIESTDRLVDSLNSVLALYAEREHPPEP